MTAKGSRADLDRNRDVAVSLMRMALALLDRCEDASFGAARLQHAIDTVCSDRSRRAPFSEARPEPSGPA